MKKLLGILLVSLASVANAGGIDCRSGVDHKHPACYGYQMTQHRHYNHHHRHHPHHPPVIINRNNDWIGPAVVTIIGGAIMADIISKNRQEAVVIQQSVPTTTCTSWVERMQSDGTVVRERTCYNH